MVPFVSFFAVLGAFVGWVMVWRAEAQLLAREPWYWRHLSGALRGLVVWWVTVGAVIWLNSNDRAKTATESPIATAEQAKPEAPKPAAAPERTVVASVAAAQPAPAQPSSTPAPVQQPSAPRVGNTEAWVISKNFVKAALRSPSTADFGGIFGQSPNCSPSGEAWTCAGWVDAQNGFGATIRSNFAITLQFRDGNWADPQSWDVLAGPLIESR